MVRWAARHVSPECRVGCSLVCRVMAKPSWKAFEVLMQMIKWMGQNKSVGLTYTTGHTTSCTIKMCITPYYMKNLDL